MRIGHLGSGDVAQSLAAGLIVHGHEPMLGTRNRARLAVWVAQLPSGALPTLPIRLAASLVTTGAIDPEAFRAAHGEVFATFSKIQPFLAELREVSGEPAFCRHLEAVVLGAPDADAILERRREAARAAARARRSDRPA